MSKTHNYPKNRKPRDTSYSKKHKLIETHGLQKIKKTWKARGMYKAAEQLGCSPYVIRDIAQSNKWQRPAEHVPHLVAAVRSGKKDPSHYKTLDFTNVNLESNYEKNMTKKEKAKKAKQNLEQEFIDYARNYNGTYTCLKDLARWMESRPAFDNAGSVIEFKNIMRNHPDFEERELYKVDRAYTKFLEDEFLRADM